MSRLPTIPSRVVGYVDFDTFEDRDSIVIHHRFKTYTHDRCEGWDLMEGFFCVSFKFVLPLLYISGLSTESIPAAVEALMPYNGSTVVRVTDGGHRSWKGTVVEFESFAALDDTLRSHQQKPFVLGEVSLQLATEEPLPFPPFDDLEVGNGFSTLLARGHYFDSDKLILLVTAVLLSLSPR